MVIPVDRVTTFTWFIPRGVQTGVTQGRTFRLTEELSAVRVHMSRSAPENDVIVIDIKADGVSLFEDDKPTIPAGLSEHTYTTIALTTLADEGAVLSLDIDSGVATDLLVQLDLEEV